MVSIKKNKISFVATVLNEEKTITALLDSLAKQSRKADEVVIVDAGSRDNTVALIKQHFIKTKLIVKPGLNRSQGRNLGIKTARNKIIAVSDAGCLLDPDWLLRITQPLASTENEAVAGYYQTAADTILGKAAAPFVAVMPDKFNPEIFLPSSRSLAFTKSAWLKVGQYPEHLDYCEDLIFAAKLKAQTNLVVKAEAIVFWQMPATLTAFYHQLKNYAVGDVLGSYWPHLIKITTTYLRYLVFFTVPPLFLAYLFWPIIKFNHYFSGFKALAYLPLVQITADFAVMRGALLGLKLKARRLVR